MECGGGSAALTKTSLFLSLTPDARISSVLSCAWNVQELSRGRDVQVEKLDEEALVQ